MFRRDPTVYDGTYANNAWLQETPKPMTQICWDNAIADQSEDRRIRLA